MPTVVRPMMAVSGESLPGDGWAYELKWDGVRAVAFLVGRGLRLQSRNLRDITSRYPELGRLDGWPADGSAVLDGEVIAPDESGVSRFERLQRRMHVAAPPASLRAEVPVAFMAFDLLWLDGRGTEGLPYVERRRLLEALPCPGPAWQVPRNRVGDGEALRQASRQLGVEGLVAKRLDSPYEEGRRSRHWVKVKNVRRQDMVVGGWLPGEGRRSSGLGALLVGYQGEGGLRYAGRVGSGFTDADLDRLGPVLGRMTRTASPFAPDPPLPREVRRLARFVEPVMVVEVAFSEWTAGGTLRAPVYKGVRPDVAPSQVRRE
ncbi:MAG TPA: non-homologous end-joining DNA ligase [Acidimicrobiales bacterium]|nr:non-homologous end-joining DNA ligase [Acidimicrobiales bacterium]